MEKPYTTLYLDAARALRDALHAKGRRDAVVINSGISTDIWIAVEGEDFKLRPLTLDEAARV